MIRGVSRGAHTRVVPVAQTDARVPQQPSLTPVASKEAP